MNMSIVTSMTKKIVFLKLFSPKISTIDSMISTIDSS